MPAPGILLFGRTGQVATELIALAEAFGIEVVALGRDAVDLTDVCAVQEAIEAVSPNIFAVVNAAAYTAVDQAEQEPVLARQVNAVAPGVMAAAAKQRNLKFIHISTDYVFDGGKDSAYNEDDPVAPLGVYGRSKLEGEQAVLAACKDAVILRTSWVFSRVGKNFLTTMLSLAESRPVLRVVDDQFGCPTPAREIARTILKILEQRERLTGGVFNFCGADPVTWKGFADSIFVAYGCIKGARPLVEGISTSEYPTPAKRPANSVLDCTKLETLYGIGAADWRAAVSEYVGEILDTGKRE